MQVDEATFRAMGSAVQVIAVGADESAVVAARERIDELERLWTRFDASSEISMINARVGESVRVSNETIDLIEHAVDGWWATDGMFDPTVLDAVIGAGYDRTFEALAPIGGCGERPRGAPGCARVEIDRRTRSVRLPDGVRIDLGGVGKGRAADDVVERLRDLGAAGALVNIGGDMRVSGAPPDDYEWPIGVEDPYTMGQIDRVFTIDDGGVATSSTLRRSWQRGGRRRHHLIDPRTGEPTDGSIDAATVIAKDATWAEMLATAVVVAGIEDGLALLRRHRATGFLYGREVIEETV